MERGELVNYYQPKVALATGKLAGVETLVRWRHPEDGLVFPDQFITTAEEHGLIDDLTKTILAAALLQYRQWVNAGLDTRVAVNVSMQSLTHIDFPDFVAKLAADSGVPVSKLVLEVTESRLMSNQLASLDIFTRLCLKGIGLSIDDFGTGHSSLAQLRDVPFSELKIDQGFVHGAWQDKSLRAIFDASLGMARQLGIKSVAEGVEDRANWNFLRTSQCDLAQGYFIGRPMPGNLIPDWLSYWDDRDLATLSA
jgi:EAL domain-containing protein (putative c-di-GMP-specific phosphodiesterase class I)